MARLATIPAIHTSLAIDQVTISMQVTSRDVAIKLNGAAFLHGVVEAFPYAIHTVLTNNDTSFAEQAPYRGGIIDRYGERHVFKPVSGVV